MGNRPWITALTGCLLLLTAACTTSVDGRPEAASTSTSTGRTIAPPSADGPASRTSASTGDSPAETSGSEADPEPTAGPESTADADPTTGPEPTAGPDPGTDPAVVLPDVLFGPVDLAAGPDGYLVFQTPSGNIFCGLATLEGTSAARCDLIEITYPEPPATPCDNGDFSAATASLVDDTAGVVGGCVSDTVIDTSAVLLPYGFNAGAGDIVCHSAEDGVTCGNLVTGHGFQVARNTYRTF